MVMTIAANTTECLDVVLAMDNVSHAHVSAVGNSRPTWNWRTRAGCIWPGTNPDTDLGLMLYDVFDLDVPCDWEKVRKPRPRITFFPARLRKRGDDHSRLDRNEEATGGAA